MTYFYIIFALIVYAVRRDIAARLFPVDYKTYIRSDAWKRKAKRIRAGVLWLCEDCGEKRLKCLR